MLRGNNAVPHLVNVRMVQFFQLEAQSEFAALQKKKCRSEWNAVAHAWRPLWPVQVGKGGSHAPRLHALPCIFGQLAYSTARARAVVTGTSTTKLPQPAFDYRPQPILHRGRAACKQPASLSPVPRRTFVRGSCLTRFTASVSPVCKAQWRVSASTGPYLLNDRSAPD